MNFSFSSQVILHAGLARSCRIHISKSKGKPSLMGRRCPSGRMRGSEKVFFPGPHPPSSTVPPPGGRGFIQGFGFCDFAFGFAQNDRGWKASCEDGRFSD